MKVISERLQKSINLLIVDDYPVIKDAMSDLFNSPIFNIICAASERQAREIIPTIPTWHGWLLDIAMEHEDSGLRLLNDNSDFPYTIMLSGIRSMHVASKAMELGAYKVFDKNPECLTLLHHEVCTMAALAFVLGGSSTKYFDLFRLLGQQELSSAEVWAKQACITVRQLERICSLHFRLSPRYLLPLFYSLRYLLLTGISTEHPIGELCPDPAVIKQINKHMTFVSNNIDAYDFKKCA